MNKRRYASTSSNCGASDWRNTQYSPLTTHHTQILSPTNTGIQGLRVMIW